MKAESEDVQHHQQIFTCPRSIIETLEKCVKYAFIVNFEYISHLFAVLLMYNYLWRAAGILWFSNYLVLF